MKESTSRPNDLDYHVSTIEAMHNIKADLPSGVGKLYEIFAVCQHNSDLTGISVVTEFKYHLEHLSEFFTSCQPDPNEGDNL